MRRSALKVLCSLSVLSLFAAPLSAAGDEWPTKPLKLVIPFPTGGTSDIMGRMVAQKLAEALKQPVTVENIPGGGGVTGTAQALKAPADGYTLIQTGVGQNAIAHGMSPKVGYDSEKDFIHLTQVHAGPNVLMVNAKQPFKTFQELVVYAKAHPGTLKYGYTPASSGHMAMELFKQTVSVCLSYLKGTKACTGLDIPGVAFRGAGPLITALADGQVPIAFINQDTAYEQVKTGKMRALAVSSVLRNPLFPNVPTVGEAGYPGFTALSWSGISVAKNTPKPVADRLEAELVKIMQSDATRQKLEASGFVVPEQGSQVYSTFVEREIGRWGRVIKIAGIKAAD